MPKIEGTKWYTAHGRDEKGKPWYGYRMSMKGRPMDEVLGLIKQLDFDGIKCVGGSVRTSSINHTDIPAGTPFIQVSDEQSVQNLERIMKEQGIKLDPYRFQIYHQQRGR